MLIKNFSKKSTRKVNWLTEFIIRQFPELDNIAIELHVKNMASRSDSYGLAFTNLETDRNKKGDKHYFVRCEPESKQLAIIYVTKTTRRRGAETWEESYVSILAHELRHLWHARDKGEERDCTRIEHLALEKYREYLSTRKGN
jgi:hypothetical protein